ncbi:MAG: hypothetical protein NTU73_11920 [Ignavibacteriae bacterium]|nr:hypothetical protein [Ignavibacteriota bacterium]
MKKYQILFLLTILIVLTTSATAQLTNTRVFKRPNVIMDATFGYALPGFDYSGSRIKDFWEFKGYGINGGYTAAFTPKVTVHNFKQGQIRTYLTVSFTQFMGSENTAYNIESLYKNWGMVPVRWPQDTLYKTPQDTLGSSSIRMSTPYIAYGWEIAMYTDKERRSIFNLGMDFNFSVMWGKIYDQPNGKLQTYNNIISSTRMGFGFNLGYSYRIMEYFGINFGTRMQLTNVFNKASDIVKPLSDGDLTLNDESNPTINKLLNKNRGIGFFGFYGGVSFYLGGKR